MLQDYDAGPERMGPECLKRCAIKGKKLRGRALSLIVSFPHAPEPTVCAMTELNKHESAKRAIIDSARPLIGARGFSAVGIAQILALARIPKGSFYHYFESKERFGEDLLTLYIADYLATLERVFSEPNQTAYEQITAYLTLWQQSHTDGKVGDKCLIVKLAAEISDLSETMRGIMQNGTSSVIGRIAQVVQRGQQEGSIIPALPAANVAAALYQAWLGATLMAKVTKSPQPFDAAWQTSVQLLKGASGSISSQSSRTGGRIMASIQSARIEANPR